VKKKAPKDKRVARGVYQTFTQAGKVSGWRVYVRVKGDLKPKRLPKTMTLGEVNEWRRNWRTDLKRGVEPPIETTPGGFADDAVKRYLPAVRALPEYSQRHQHIMEWIDVFGDRPRSSIKSHEIAAQRDRWLLEGPRRRMKKDPDSGKAIVIDGRLQWEFVAEPLSPQSVRLRLRALSNLWTVLDGRRAANPVREVAEPETIEEDPPKALPSDVIDTIFAAAPDRGRPENGERATMSKSKIRARCLRYTGMAPCELARVRRHHIQIEQKRVWATPRRKGTKKKTKRQGRWIPLEPEALEAFADLVKHDAVGDFSVQSLGKCFARWVTAAGFGGLGITIYWLRHSVGTDAYAASGDIRGVQELLGQSDQRSTMRYAQAAVAPRVLAVMRQMRRMQQKKVTGKVTGNKKASA
jgi:integrase